MKQAIHSFLNVYLFLSE